MRRLATLLLLVVATAVISCSSSQVAAPEQTASTVPTSAARAVIHCDAAKPDDHPDDVDAVDIDADGISDQSTGCSSPDGVAQLKVVMSRCGTTTATLGAERLPGPATVMQAEDDGGDCILFVNNGLLASGYEVDVLRLHGCTIEPVTDEGSPVQLAIVAHRPSSFDAACERDTDGRLVLVTRSTARSEPQGSAGVETEERLRIDDGKVVRLEPPVTTSLEDVDADPRPVAFSC